MKIIIIIAFNSEGAGLQVPVILCNQENEVADQTTQMCRLVCAFVVCMQQIRFSGDMAHMKCCIWTLFLCSGSFDGIEGEIISNYQQYCEYFSCQFLLSLLLSPGENTSLRHLRENLPLGFFQLM